VIDILVGGNSLMADQLPLDSDGDALRRLLATGSDLSKELEIDFAMLFPTNKQVLR
jgi:hypothetical protein